MAPIRAAYMKRDRRRVEAIHQQIFREKPVVLVVTVESNQTMSQHFAGEGPGNTVPF
jgi:hypothetical protein